jgi:DNA-binding MarR family transcriptional regulator
MTRTAALRSIEDEIGILLRRLKREIAERAQLIHPDLQGTSYFLLGWLAQNGPVRASAIVGVFGMDKGALSRQLQHLEELGLVQRSPDPADGRATLVSVSEDASRRLGEVDGQRRAVAGERLAEWSVAELEEFAHLLGRYNRSLS